MSETLLRMSLNSLAECASEKVSVRMKNLVIVGASAFGREVCSYAEDCGFRVKGFLDTRTDILSDFKGYPAILATPETYHVLEDDVFVSATGNPKEKLSYAGMLAARGARFATIVHPTAYVGRNVALGEGCIVCPHATLTNDVVLACHVAVNVSAGVNHDNVIGEGVTISPGAQLAGRVRLGARVFVGIGATVMPDVSLGNDVVVAAGAVVTRSFATGVVLGVPARQKALS